MSNPIKHLIQIVESNQYEIPESDIDITAEHIVKVPGGYELKSKKTGRNLGKYPTRAGAEKRERQVQYFKHANEDTAISMIDDDISDLQNFVRAAYKAELGFNPDWSQEEWHDREFLMHWLERLTTYQSDDDDDDTDVSVSELHETASDLTPDELRSWGDRPVTFKSSGFEHKVRSYTNHGDRLYLNIDSDDGRKIEREYSYSQLQGEVKQSSKGQRLSISLKPFSEAEETHQEKRDRIKKLTPAITRKQSGVKDWKLKPKEVSSRIHDTDYQNRTAHDINQGSAEASLNELSKDTLDSYRKKRSAINRLDRQSADRARDIAANKRTYGDDQKAAEWEDEADWLDNRAKKGEKGVALAATKQGVTEGSTDELHADLSDKYNELAPGIEKYKDEKGADHLYKELLAIARHHGAEREFSRMCNGARNRAHMDYDTNPGHFKNWFWYLGLGNEQGVTEGYILKKTNIYKYVNPGDPDVKVKNTDYEIINNKTGQPVGTASWTTNDYFGPGALEITMNNGATRYLDIWERERGNPQTAFNRFVKDPKTAKKYKEQDVAEGATGDKPGWARTPALAQRVKNSKYEVLKRWAGKPVPKEQGEAEGSEQAWEVSFSDGEDVIKVHASSKQEAISKATQIAKSQGNPYPSVDWARSKEQGMAEEASPMIKPPNNRFDNKQEAFKYAKEHGGSVFRSQYIDPNTGVKNISFVVKKKDS